MLRFKGERKLMNIDISDMRYNTTRLCIRPFVQADFNDVYKYASVESFTKLIGWQNCNDREHCKLRFVDLVNRKDSLWCLLLLEL